MKRSAEKADRFLRHLQPLEGMLAAYARRSLRHPDDLGDVLQSAVALAYRDFDLYAEGTNFRAWIFRYVTFEVLNRNRARSRSREVGLFESAAGPIDAECDRPSEIALDRLLDDPERVLDECDEVLSRAVRELTATERSILLLRAIGEFKYREIAAILEIPIGTVMGLLSRGRERIRRRLAEAGQQLSPADGEGEGTRSDRSKGTQAPGRAGEVRP